MIVLLATLVLAASGAACVGVIAWALTRNVLAGAALVLGVYLAEVIFVALPGMRVGVFIYPQDIVFVLLGVSACIRLARGVNTLQLVLLAYSGLVLGSFVRGVQHFGIHAAGVDARAFVYLAAGALYFSTFEIGPSVQRALARILAFTASVMLAVAVFRWIATALQLPVVEQWASITTNPIRVLHSAHALFLSQCAILAFAVHLERRGRGRYLAGLLFAAILLLQHRTVWVETLVVAFLGVLLSGRLRGRLVLQGAALGLLGAVFTVAMFGSRLQALGESLRASATGDETWTWRVQGWVVLIRRFLASDPVTLLMGAPFGSGYSRTIGLSEITVSPHNFYVHNLLRVGFLGLALLLALYALLLVHIPRGRSAQPRPWLRPGLVQLLLVSQLLYFVTYAPAFEQSVLLGLAFGYLRAARPRRPAAPLAIKPSPKAWPVPERPALRPS